MSVFVLKVCVPVRGCVLSISNKMNYVWENVLEHERILESLLSLGLNTQRNKCHLNPALEMSRLLSEFCSV